MRLPHLSRLLLVLALLAGGSALAQRRQLRDFQGETMTQEERDAERSGSKYNINAYSRDIQIKEEPIPWMAIGLVGLIFLAVAPFAIRAYLSTSKEIADTNTFGTSSARGEGDPE
jgi:hypothetical protein